jgi:hypothetical protein
MGAALVLTPRVDAPRAPGRYQSQMSAQTLAEGLAEYYARNRGRVTPPGELPPESVALFRSHDICHVVFGLDTTFADEAMADTRTMLSSDVGWTRYAAYLANDSAAKAILREVGYAAFVLGTLRATPRILRAVIEAFRMKKRWPWTPPEAHLARPLADLRAEYGIRVI